MYTFNNFQHVSCHFHALTCNSDMMFVSTTRFSVDNSDMHFECMRTIYVCLVQVQVQIRWNYVHISQAQIVCIIHTGYQWCQIIPEVRHIQQKYNYNDQKCKYNSSSIHVTCFLYGYHKLVSCGYTSIICWTKLFKYH